MYVMTSKFNFLFLGGGVGGTAQLVVVGRNFPGSVLRKSFGSIQGSLGLPGVKPKNQSRLHIRQVPEPWYYYSGPAT